MKPAPFAYVGPRSIAEALEALARYGSDARALAGGQSLVPLMNLRMARPAALIDLGRVSELAYIRRDGDWLAIGAMTRQADAEHSALVSEVCPLVARALPYLGHPAIRHRGTIGGTLAHADRVAELTAVAVALDAELVAAGPTGRRTIPARAFFVGDLSNSLAPGELLVEARFPIAPASARSAFVEAANRHHDLAIVGVACQIDVGPEERIRGARIAIHGAGPTPIRLSGAEAALIGTPASGEQFAQAAQVTRLALDDVTPEDDMYASASYRRHVTPGLVERALSLCMSRAT